LRRYKEGAGEKAGERGMDRKIRLDDPSSLFQNKLVEEKAKNSKKRKGEKENRKRKR